MASEFCELEDAAVAEELDPSVGPGVLEELDPSTCSGTDEELEGFTTEELCGTLEEDCAVAELDTTDELEEFTEDELGTEALEAGTSFLATPLAAKSGAWPALIASMERSS